MNETAEQVLSTMQADGSRRWLKPRLSRGRFRLCRALVAYVLMALFFVLPFVQINGHPAILLDIPRRKFAILGYMFLPTDTVLLALFMLTVFVTIFLFTALFGRLWCGWACPQTVYLEFLYRPLERLFDATIGRGGRPERGVGPMRKAAYFLAAFVATLIPAHTFLAYFVGVENLRHWMASSPFEHPAAFVIMAATTLLMLFDFYYFREQLCILACPYGRFQSVLLDPWSLIVSYDKRRGEPRGKKSVELKIASVEPDDARQGVGGADPATVRGDCVDCTLCVQTCPTGIDIRNGLQMECVNCTQCIDACDAVMDKIGKPRGLIRYSSQAIDAGQRKVLRPRVVLYPILLAVLVGIFVLIFSNKSPADVLLTRTAGSPYTRFPTGEIANSLRIKITNRTDQPASYVLAIIGPGADKVHIILSENPLALQAAEARQEPFLMTADPSLLSTGSATVTLRVTSGSDVIGDVPVRLLGPGTSAHANGGTP